MLEPFSSWGETNQSDQSTVNGLLDADVDLQNIVLVFLKTFAKYTKIYFFFFFLLYWDFIRKGFSSK